MEDLMAEHSATKNMTDAIDIDRLRGDLDALKGDIAALGSEMTSALKAIAGTAQNRARHGYRKAQDNVTSTVSDLKQQGASALEGARSTAEGLEESLEDAVRERPLAALGLAIGLGFLIGVTWRR
jgi:ElaB/YqjD/DUF883 family membrane-anchored ribosome-binding protein